MISAVRWPDGGQPENVAKYSILSDQLTWSAAPHDEKMCCWTGTSGIEILEYGCLTQMRSDLRGHAHHKVYFHMHLNCTLAVHGWLQMKDNECCDAVTFIMLDVIHQVSLFTSLPILIGRRVSCQTRMVVRTFRPGWLGLGIVFTFGIFLSRPFWLDHALNFVQPS